MQFLGLFSLILTFVSACKLIRVTAELPYIFDHLNGALSHSFASFSSPESYCCHPDVGIGLGMGVTLKNFMTKFIFL